MSWLGNDLPSIVNEREAIFSASWIKLFVLASGLALLMLGNNPATPPDTIAFLMTAAVNGVVLSLCWLLLAPKMKRVMSGEKVVLSKLLQERDPIGMDSFTGEQIPHPSQFSDSIPPPALGSSVGSQSRFDNKERNYSKIPSMSQVEASRDAGNYQQQQLFMEAAPAAPTTSLYGQSSVTSLRHIALKATDPPPRRFEEQLLGMRNIVSSVASRSLEGRPMNQEDWNALKVHSQMLNEMLGKIEYHWDIESECE
eukprot:CAMPEP_0118720040 /NCGR_PEP_ID=MMETSP0800-20121206/29872_1 /TAXON_ID=210618 ORGANISM="Striatella unipunctata, Strain CCMP2910" /NCGR_SAMPLE_ID=MMETSP0800 /ASSEMBLY_ACC=CAM_ASM_000638 /LENGTH=253 /DNA_ID=CAMNT_0006627601 /DNA_START=288 /DNA_END=1049 /DNA_ORIENTATION=-